LALLHPNLLRFVEAARWDMPARGWIGFQSNGQLLTRELAVGLAAAGVDRVCLSADAVCPDLFRALRVGASMTEERRVVEYLLGLARRARDGDTWISFERLARG
jgi:uncharacterized Fe-S cluster-containing radical SAM superfamily enzyme